MYKLTAYTLGRSYKRSLDKVGTNRVKCVEKVKRRFYTDGSLGLGARCHTVIEIYIALRMAPDGATTANRRQHARTHVLKERFGRHRVGLYRIWRWLFQLHKLYAERGNRKERRSLYSLTTSDYSLFTSTSPLSMYQVMVLKTRCDTHKS